ncbi:uncharacterized protein F5Z01DRAFT_547902 [Emericellopsis atlantica]|uniref:F-box domain-containing protein n=1 Tax=Emericellopsis atlantica TaxID=2614577 RepID=A0A9P7ZNV8_9HYPO|nr:uncharacterized protein F5Z01DRAFT_547902 [Emericellopsis atlantica]KAG9255564.1 hypothetical protein F5Z01DRAFT_547902 [Emericellopsis atlantica]
MDSPDGRATSGKDQLIAQTNRLALDRFSSPAYIDAHDHLEADERKVVAARPDRPGLRGYPCSLADLPNEVLLHVFAFLDVSDLLVVSRTTHHLRSLCVSPILHTWRLRLTRTILPPLLYSRPSRQELIARSIFLTQTTVVSRRLARSLTSIRLSRRLATRPSPEVLVERAVLPKECVPGLTTVHLTPRIVQRKKTIERERIKDGLRRWIEGTWRGRVEVKELEAREWEERWGVGRVWRLRRFWEKMSRGEVVY